MKNKKAAIKEAKLEKIRAKELAASKKIEEKEMIKERKACAKEARRRIRIEQRRIRRGAVKAFSRLHVDLIAYMLCASLVLILAEFALLALFGFDKASEIYYDPHVFWILQAVAMYAVAFPLFHRSTKKIPSATYEKSKLGFGKFLGYFFIAEAVMNVGNIISLYLNTALSEITGLDFLGVNIADPVGDAPMYLTIPIVVIIGPIVEEIIFRKVLIDKMSIYGKRMAIIASSFAFGFFHGNFSQLLYATLLGFLLGHIYAKTGRVRYTIVIHMLVNLFGSVPALLLERGIIEEWVALLIIYIPALIGLVLYSVFARRGEFKVQGEPEKRLSKFGVFRAMFFNFGTILFYFFMIMALCATVIPEEFISAFISI